MRKRLIAIAGALALLCSAACTDDRGPDSAEAALTTLRQAVATADGSTIYRLYDVESRGYFRDQVRAWRAAVDGGKPIEEVLPETLDWSRELLLDGTEEEATTRLLARHSSFAVLGDWFQEAVVVGREESVPGEARLELEGPDGQVRSIWFVEQAGGWAYDHYRSRW